MKKIILIFITILFADDYMTYLSPGIQIGINSSGNIFTSLQLTIGEFNNEWGSESGDFDSKGITVGVRFYKGQKITDIYFYIDIQTALDPLALSGTGCGLVFNSQGEIYPKVKFWTGAYFNLTYDFILFSSRKHNLGLIGVLPLPKEAVDRSI